MSDRSRVLVPLAGALTIVIALTVVMLGVGALLEAVPVSAGTSPAPYVVTTTDDELDADPRSAPEDLSLREATWLAGRDFDSSTVVLQEGATYELDRCGPAQQEDQGIDGDLDLVQDQSLFLDGRGATIRQTCAQERVLDFFPEAAVLRIEHVTLTGGRVSDRGGALRLIGGEPILRATGITVQDNRAGQGGGGIYQSRGETRIDQSTIAGNEAVQGRGGGVWAQSGLLDLVRSTVTHNVGDLEGGGVAGPDLFVGDSTFVANVLRGDGVRAGAHLFTDGSGLLDSNVFAFGVGASDCSDGFDSVVLDLDSDGTCTDALDGDAFRGVHAQLGPLADHGGPTATHRPAVGSAALEAIPSGRPELGCSADGADQRGEPRPDVGGVACDLGAVEEPAASCTPAAFPDVGAAHRFSTDVCWLDQMGIAGGFPDGTFRPAAPVTRQSMAAFVHRFALAPPIALPTTPSFSDVGRSHPFFAEVEWLAGAGIAQGFADGTFRPGTTVSRQAMATFLFRISGDVGYVGPEASSFADVPLGHPFFASIHWAAEHELTTGYVDGTWRPSSPVSRQAAAAFLRRLAGVPFLDGI
jgi:hypothetical protein